MKSHDDRVEAALQRALSRHGKAPNAEVDSAMERAWMRLLPHIGDARDWSLEQRGGRQPLRRLLAPAVVSAAVGLLLLAIAISRSRPAAYATVDGPGLYSGTSMLALRSRVNAGDVVRSAVNGTAFLSLADGTRIEMQADSELSLQRAADGIRIALTKGGVLVSAARQREGHLYVTTKDVTVSVVGTVFMVRAEGAGSRVAVIQGEVHVQQGESQSTLLSGEQMVTGLEMPALPLAKELAWSREAPLHLATLQENRPGMPAKPETAPPLEFSAASIRPHDGAPNGRSLGYVCRGSDRTVRAPGQLLDFREGPIDAPQGRCVGRGVLLSNLIGFAHDVLPRDVKNLPEWAVPPDPLAPANAFQIEAVADDTSGTTAEQLRTMTRTLLVQRFRLQLHRETQTSPGYVLVVGKKGPMLKEKEPAAAEEYPAIDRKALLEERRSVLKGVSTLNDLAQWLSTTLGIVVADHTSLPAVYDYRFPLIDQRADVSHQGSAGPPSAEDRAAEISRLMEAAIGLRLEKERSIAVEMIVVESVAKPEEN